MNYKWANKKLKSCPFCGGESELLPQVFPPYDKKGFMIRCIRCSARKLSFSKYQLQAVCEWNVRCVNGKIIPHDQ